MLIEVEESENLQEDLHSARIWGSALFSSLLGEEQGLDLFAQVDPLLVLDLWLAISELVRRSPEN